MGANSNATKTESLIGKKFGRWLVISAQPTNRYRKVLCRCECGTEKILSATDITRLRTKSCGCFAAELASKRMKKYTYPSGFIKIISQYKREANKKKLDFLLTIQEFFNLTQDICFYCGKKPSNSVSRYSDGPFIYNGVDRVNNKEGYTIDNCVTCCSVCNEMKTSLDISVFMKHISLIYERHLNGQKTPQEAK